MKIERKIIIGILSGILLLSAFPAFAQDGFVYDAHGRRDPFWPLVSTSGAILSYHNDLKLDDMVLEGIIYDPKSEKFAIINSRVVKASDDIGGFLVVAVYPDSVVLSKQGQEFTLNLKKE